MVEIQNYTKQLDIVTPKGLGTVYGGGDVEDYIRDVTCTGSGSKAICLATSKELLSISRDGGENWYTREINKKKYGVTCVPHSNDTFCIVWGSDDTLDISKDGAETWETKKITIANKEHGLAQGACTGKGPNVNCTLVGYYKDGSPLIIVGTNTGEKWNAIKIDNLPIGYLRSVSATE